MSTKFLNSRFGSNLSTFIIISIGLIMVPIAAILVLIWRKLTKATYKSLGLYKPTRIIKTIVIGVVLGILLKLFSATIFMPLIGYPSQGSGAFLFIQESLTNALLMSVYIIIVAGFCEEIVFRGFFFKRFESWFGSSRRIKVTMVIIGSLLFGIPHIYQGFHGAMNSIVIGAIYGMVYLMNKKNLWLVMISHATYDLLATYIIYNGLTKTISTLFFN
ncbi:MAG: CPBP family intramembrane glutamic endopeptidase [Psychroserpens sp.]|uniref:CPBP family intramembrane glutamic endopeptidase n=1 Tax=Psychroserpens sp. TaxID=2020870 RepID=UPI003001972D